MSMYTGDLKKTYIQDMEIQYFVQKKTPQHFNLLHSEVKTCLENPRNIINAQI